MPKLNLTLFKESSVFDFITSTTYINVDREEVRPGADAPEVLNMNVDWLQAWGWLVGVAVDAIVGTVIGIVVHHYYNKRQKEKAELEALREEKRAAQEEKRCSVTKEAVHAEMMDMKVELKSDIKPLQEDLDLMKKTMQKDVRRSLRQDGKMYIDRQYASQQEKTEFDELYWAYHNLGKNGVVDRLHDEVMGLPDEPKGDK